MSHEPKPKSQTKVKNDIEIGQLKKEIEKKDRKISENKEIISNFIKNKTKNDEEILSLRKEIKTKNIEIETLINNYNEQIKELKAEITEIKSGIILSTANANRSGRRPLSAEVHKKIRELRAEGYSQRKVAEMLGISNGAVAKYDKLDEVDEEW